MVRKTKIKRKRNVKKTRRRRIRGGVKTAAQLAREKWAEEQAEERAAAQLAGKQRADFGRSLAAQQADEERKAKEADKEWANTQQKAAWVQERMKAEQANNRMFREQRWADEDELKRRAKDKEPRGLMSDTPFADHDIAGQISRSSEKAKRQKTPEVIARNKALMDILYSFFTESTKILDDITEKKTVLDEHKMSARNLIKSTVSAIASKVENDFNGGWKNGNGNDYLIKVGAISTNAIDELFPRIIWRTYFTTVLSSYDLLSTNDETDINNNMTKLLTKLLLPTPYIPISDSEAFRNIDTHMAKVEELKARYENDSDDDL